MMKYSMNIINNKKIIGSIRNENSSNNQPYKFEYSNIIFLTVNAAGFAHSLHNGNKCEGLHRQYGCLACPPLPLPPLLACSLSRLHRGHSCGNERVAPLAEARWALAPSAV